MQAGGAIIDDGGFAITIAGTLIHDPALGASPDGGLTKLGAGTLTLSGTNSFWGPTYINAGTLALSGSGLISAVTNLYIAPGAMLNVSGTINNGNFTFGNGARISGSGTCFGLTTLTSGAVLAPGSNSFGTLTFTNYSPSVAQTLRLQTGCTNIFKVSHLPLTNDSIKIYGQFALGGAAIVTNAGGTRLAAGDTFKLFDAASYSGAISGVQLPPLAAGLAWNTSSLNTAGTISVVLNTAPVIGSIFYSGGNLGLSGTGGVGNAYYVLLGTTNLSGGNWSPLLTNQFDNSGNFNFTTNANTSSPQTFYRLQLQ